MRRLKLLIPVIVLVAFCVTPLSAFAANNPNLKESSQQQKPLYPAGSTTDVIYPAWNFLGCGTGWNYAYDPYLHYFGYAYTTGSQACSSAVWDDHNLSQNHTCDIAVYIPTILATAYISYGFYRANGSLITRAAVHQGPSYGWIGLKSKVVGIHHILISSNNGENNTYMAAGQMQFACY